jgi:transposase-like protein/IS1 family transposase
VSKPFFVEKTMNPQPSFCPNLACPSRGVIGAGNLRVHDSLRNRWKCRVCHKTFSGRKGTVFYGLKTEEQIVVWVLSLLAFGCPPQAIVATFALDERTVYDWQKRAGQHCEAVHQALVQTPQNLKQVQADEIRVRCQRGLVLWMAMALCVPTRLWLGGVVSANRDKSLAKTLAQQVLSCARLGALLVTTDGWVAYKDAFQKAFRSAIHTGQRGRPARLAWPDLVLAQTVKWQQAGGTIGIRVCHLVGNLTQVARLLLKGQGLQTAYIERLNATFRQRLCGLCRRTRCLVRSEATLSCGMYLVGTVYNFCTPHQSLGRKGQPTTPAMAAGRTKHLWSVFELLAYPVAPPPYVAPKRRGRKPKKATEQTKKEGALFVTA